MLICLLLAWRKSTYEKMSRLSMQNLEFQASIRIMSRADYDVNEFSGLDQILLLNKKENENKSKF